MCRQFLHRAPAPAARPADRDRPGPRIGRGTAVLIATGLLTGVAAPATAQQAPDGWSAERSARLPSGLDVRFDFVAAPEVTAEAAPGKLAERPGGGSAYADGIRPGDPAETFRAAERRTRADGSWHTLGTLRLSFSRPVRNPRLHVSGLTGLTAGKGGTTGTGTRLIVTGGAPAAPALVGRTGWNGWKVGADSLTPTVPDGDADDAGTLELSGTVSTVELRVDRRSTARAGSTTAPVTPRQAWTVTLDEDLGSAPPDYGTASHLVSDLFLGQDAARVRPGLAQSVANPLLPGPTAGAPPPLRETGRLAPEVRADDGEGRRSPWATPLPDRLRPARAEYRGTDPSLAFPTGTAAGQAYRLDVPVSTGAGPAVLAGWIDFDHNGRFDQRERVQADVPAGAGSATLEWQVPAGAVGGDTWVRLRLAHNGAQLVAPDGFADSGQVVDQQIALALGAAAPEIGLPVPGSVTAEVRPEFRGDDAPPGADIAVQEGGSTLCTARPDSDGRWSCRPDSALAEGAHTLTVATTAGYGGAALRGDPFRLTVKTTPPTAPVLTLPAFTNDPGLLVTGLGEPGSTVTVSADTGPDGTDLCSIGVGADGSWSCLPVENLADGRHRLTPHALDAAGNHADGKPVALTVDTVAPDRPHLASPSSGALLPTVRPALAGRAEPGSTVTVTARPGEGERATVCSAVAAADGAWSCTAARDLPAGEVTLLPTATDPAGNGTPGDAVTVRLSAAPAPGNTAAPAPAASPTRPAPSVPAPSASVATRPVASSAPAASPVVVTPSVPSALAQSPSPAAPGGQSLFAAHPPAAAAPEHQLPAATATPPRQSPPTVAPPSGSSPATTPPASTPPVGTPSPGAPGASRPVGVPVLSVAAPVPRDVPSADAEAPAEPAAGGGEEHGVGPVRALAAPPPNAVAAEHRAAATGWRGLACGALLIAAALGLLARRVFGSRPR
ncbi:Ig-like domain-containing protein [Kitasatospora sp. NPDC059646]|uniref:Ig-like domain-containing protein n=1 Tax=Kitasatospora sp. NPDC059646 TaxID=3346893 RepID=UPI00369901FA